MKIGGHIHRVQSCPSTNDLAKQLAQAGEKEGTVVIADEQTRGKGTKGRRWHSPRKKGLYASVILNPLRSDLFLLPLVAGIAAAEAIQMSTKLEVKLKWPNDIVWGKKKLGGILCEGGFLGSEPSYVIMGIGLNLSQQSRDFPPAIRRAATSLGLILRRNPDQASLERHLIQALSYWYAIFCAGKKMKILRAFQSKLIFSLGMVIIVKREKERITGVFGGIDSRGRLKLQKGGNWIRFSPGEIDGLEIASPSVLAQ